MTSSAPRSRSDINVNYTRFATATIPIKSTYYAARRDAIANNKYRTTIITVIRVVIAGVLITTVNALLRVLPTTFSVGLPKSTSP